VFIISGSEISFCPANVELVAAIAC